MSHHGRGGGCNTVQAACNANFCNELDANGDKLCSVCGTSMLQGRLAIEYWDPVHTGEDAPRPKGLLFDSSKTRHVRAHKYSCGCDARRAAGGVQAPCLYHSDLEHFASDTRAARRLLHKAGFKHYDDGLTSLVADMRIMDMFTADTGNTPPSAYFARTSPSGDATQVITFVHMDELYTRSLDRRAANPWARVGVHQNWKRDEEPAGGFPAHNNRDAGHAAIYSTADTHVLDSTGGPQKCNYSEFESRQNPGFNPMHSFPDAPSDRSDGVWWEDNKITTTRMLLDGEDAGLVSFYIDYRDDGPHEYVQCLYVVNVTVNSAPQFRRQGLAQYILWYAQQLAVFINRHTGIGADKKGYGLIQRVYFITKLGNVAMCKTAEKVGMQSIRGAGCMYPVSYGISVPLPPQTCLRVHKPPTRKGFVAGKDATCVYTNKAFPAWAGAPPRMHAVLVHDLSVRQPPASVNLSIIQAHTLAEGCAVSDAERLAFERLLHSPPLRRPSMEAQTLGPANPNGSRHYLSDETGVKLREIPGAKAPRVPCVQQ